MVEQKKKVDNRSLNLLLGAIFIVLVTAGFFMTYLRPGLTGNVVLGQSDNSSFFGEGNYASYENVTWNGNAVAVESGKASGVYVSKVFDAVNDSVWNNLTFEGNNVSFEVCASDNCSDEDFNSVDLNDLNVTSRYFQYKILFNSADSNLTSVSLDYSVVESGSETSDDEADYNLPISVVSPEEMTYHNESVFVEITAANSSSIWFGLDGTNESYSSATTKTLSDGNYTLMAWANDSEGNLNSTSVSFEVDSLYCGDNICNEAEDCASCSADCGVCEDDEEQNSESSESDNSNKCTPDWKCADWGECVNGTQTRTCSDANACGLIGGKPVTSQTCEVVIAETCSDGIRNQDERGIDCGGVCDQRCGVFTIVGNAVSGSLEGGKQFFFGSTVRTIIIFGTLGLIVALLVVARVRHEKGYIKSSLKNFFGTVERRFHEMGSRRQ